MSCLQECCWVLLCSLANHHQRGAKGEEQRQQRQRLLRKLAEQAKCYDEMAEHMNNVSNVGSTLSVQERNLLSVASKNAVGSRCAAWRIITSVEQKEKSKGNNANVYFAKLAEQAERCDEMALHMKSVGSVGSPLSVQERNLLPVTSMNAIGSRCAAWQWM